MKIAFFGDIVGKTGRKKLESSLQQYVLDEKVNFSVFLNFAGNVSF